MGGVSGVGGVWWRVGRSRRASGGVGISEQPALNCGDLYMLSVWFLR